MCDITPATPSNPAAETLPRYDFANAHLAWFACLSALLNRIRSEGLMCIEAEVDNPASPQSLFSRFPQTATAPYREFACDLLRLMVGGMLELAPLTTYAETAIQTLSQKRHWYSCRPDVTLLQTIWLTLSASVQGVAPVVAGDFGRQAIPQRLRPSHAEYEALYRAYCNTWRQPSAENALEMDARIRKFITAIR